jgi:hypothetical protein
MNQTPNWFATLALLCWPLMALWLFRTRPLKQAVLWTILGGYLLLPVRAAIKIEGIPQFDKVSIPNLAVLIGCLMMGWRPRLFSQFGLLEVLLTMYLVGPFVSSMMNPDPILLGGGMVLPGVGAYDGLSATVAVFLEISPFFIARQLLRSEADHEEILRVLVIAGLIYSLPILFELRMAPQLHLWLYGTFPSSYVAEARYGGFRPVVFLRDGLVVAIFMMTVVLAAAAFWRTKTPVLRVRTSALTAYLGGILILCKASGALLIGAALVPLVRFTRPSFQVRIAVGLVAIALFYPTLRSLDLVPTGFLINLASSVDKERASSLETRFDQEQQLLQHASERFWFGWGRFNRSRVFDEFGKDISITDGRWIITMGDFGFFSFLAEFGLIALAVVRAALVIKFVTSPRDAVLLGALTLILAAYAIDQIPNDSLSPWTWLLTGSLLGRAEALRLQARGRSNEMFRRTLGVAGA